MSRIGNKIIPLTEGLTVKVNADNVEVKGKLGEDVVYFDPEIISIEVCEDHIKVKRANDEKRTKQLHGTTRALLHNAMVGVSEGFKKELEIIGIGYRAEMRGKDIVLHIGHANEHVISPLEGVTITCKDTTHVTVSGIDKFAVGQTAALIRATRKPEPYLGKGIKYKDEVILRKEGKRAGKK